MDRATAVRLQERRGDGVAVAGQRAAAVVGVDHGREVVLQVQAGQAGPRVHEATGLGDVRGQWAPPAHEVVDEVTGALGAGEADRSGGEPQDRHGRVVLEVAAHARQVGDDVDASCAQIVRRPHAGQQEQLR
jgi:hypothetical protein